MTALSGTATTGLSLERLAVEGWESHRSRTADGDSSDIALGDLRYDPHDRQVCDPVELIPGHHTLTVDRLFFEDGSACRRRPFDRAPHCTAFLNLADARFRHPQAAQLLRAAVDHRHLVRIVHGPSRFDGQRILELRLNQRRAIEAEQRLARLYRLSGRVDMQ